MVVPLHKPGRLSAWRFWPAFIVPALIFVCVPACSIKTQVKVAVSPKIGAAKTATLQELLAMLQDFSSRVQSLISPSVKITLTTGREDSGILQKYPRAPGTLLLRRPGDLRLTVSEPLAHTTILLLCSHGDEFDLYLPRDQKMYVGSNSARGYQFEDEGKPITFNARPTDIFDAILPPPLPLGQPGMHISWEEWQDSQAKYYVLTLLQETGGLELRPLRKFWIERSQMAVVKQITFTDAGELSSIADYSNLSKFEGVLMPCLIRIDRPREDYSLELIIREWRINPKMDDSMFVLTVPDGTKRILLKEKGTAGY